MESPLLFLPFLDSLVSRKIPASFSDFEMKVGVQMLFEWTLTIHLWFGPGFEARESSSHILGLSILVLSEKFEGVPTVLTLEFHLSRYWLCFRGTSRQHMPFLVNWLVALSEQVFLWEPSLADFSVPPQQLLYSP